MIAEDTLKMIESKNSEQYILDLSKRNNEPEWLLKKRLDAFNTFKSMKMPNFIYGLNINMNIALDLDAININDSARSNIKINNPDEQIIIEDFAGMLKNHENILMKNFMSLVHADEKFTSFHAAFLNNLAFVYVPRNTEAKAPIELASVIGQDVVFEHLIILVEDNSKVTLVEDSKSSNNQKISIKTISNNNDSNKKIKEEKTNNMSKDNEKNSKKNAKNTGSDIKNQNNENNDKKNLEINNNHSYPYRSKIVELFIGKNCIVNYGNVQMLDSDAFNFTIKKASVGQNSTLNWMDCCFGSKVTLSEVTTHLDGEHAVTNNHGLFFGSKKQQFDLVAKSIHNAPLTISDILTKGALTDSSKCVYRGLVRIEQNAFGSNGYQKEDTLLLSSDAQADSIPNLEIENNEVRCTHGASIGRIDSEKLFYIMSRGLDRDLATREYVKAFFEPLIQKIQIEKLRENMHGIIGKGVWDKK